MSPRTLLSGTAIVMAGLGLTCLFFPAEFAAQFGFPAGSALVFQLFSAGLLAMASLNWMGRGAIYGAIYGRPIVVANFGFGTVMGGSLISALLDGALTPWAWTLAVVAVLHALAFWRLMHSPPWGGDAA